MEKKFDIDKAIELFKKGHSWRQIARAVGVKHPYSVSFQLNKLGYTSTVSKGQPRQWDVEEARLLRAQGLSIEQLSELFNVSPSAISRGLRDK